MFLSNILFPLLYSMNKVKRRPTFGIPKEGDACTPWYSAESTSQLYRFLLQVTLIALEHSQYSPSENVPRDGTKKNAKHQLSFCEE